MSFSIAVTPLAESDIFAAREWYDSQRYGLGEEFLRELDATLRRVEEFGDTFEHVSERLRRIQLPRFPYLVIYEIRGHEAQVKAVMHTSRRPGLWKRR